MHGLAEAPRAIDPSSKNTVEPATHPACCMSWVTITIV